MRSVLLGGAFLSGACTPAHDFTWHGDVVTRQQVTPGEPVPLSLGTVSAATAARIGSLRYTPLPHDHQRLLRRCAGAGCLEYGPEARVLAVEALGGWNTEAHFNTPRVVSVLKFYESGGYAPLGLNSVARNAEYNVTLQRSGSVWTGSLVNVANSADLTSLRVTRTQYTNPRPPPSTRFMRSADGEVGIGVQCADGWCILSLAAWVAPTDRVDCTGMPATCGVPGFSDEQELAKCKVGFLCLGGLERSQVVGGFYPIDTLALVTDAGLALGYTTVAYSRSVTGVYKKGKVRIRPATTAIATIQMRVRGMNGNVPRYDLRVISVNDEDVADTTEHRDIKVYAHSEVFDYGTVRWLWDPRDEGLWIRCPAGCCRSKL